MTRRQRAIVGVSFVIPLGLTPKIPRWPTSRVVSTLSTAVYF